MLLWLINVGFGGSEAVAPPAFCTISATLDIVQTISATLDVC